MKLDTILDLVRGIRSIFISITIFYNNTFSNTNIAHSNEGTTTYADQTGMVSAAYFSLLISYH